MYKILIITAIVCFPIFALLAQDKPFELAHKLNAADRAAAMKMFPELENKSLLGVEEEQVLIGGDLKKLTRFFFHLPLSKEAKALYYCYKLKNSSNDVRKLAAQNLRPYPLHIADSLKELGSEKDTKNFDLAAAALLEFASTGFHKDSSSFFALYWEWEDRLGFCLLDGKMLGLLISTEAVLRGAGGTVHGVRSEMKQNILRFKSLGKGTDFASVLRMRLAAVQDKTTRSDLKLALAFLSGDLDHLLKILLGAETDSFSKELALEYLEKSGKPEVVQKILGAVDKTKSEPAVHLLLKALRRTVPEYCNSQEIVRLAFQVEKKLGESAMQWVREILLQNARRDIAQTLNNMAKDQKDEKKKARYSLLAREVAQTYQSRERADRGILPKSDWITVTASLRWLHFHQDRNGQWDSDGFGKNCDNRKSRSCGSKGRADYDMGATSLALLAFLSKNHSHREGMFKKTVKRGLDWIRGQQTETGCFGDLEGRLSIESHAIATKAICEAYAVTEDYRLKDNALCAVKFLLSRQGKTGGWKKGKMAKLPDVVTTAWAVYALKAAKTAGLEVPDKNIEKALSCFDMRVKKHVQVKGGFVDTRWPQAPAAIAAASILCGRSVKDERFLAAVDLLHKNPPKWDDGAGPAYWYFGTRVMFRHGGKKWDKWVKALKKTLLDSQRVGGCADGSWDTTGPDAKKLGRVGTTALNQLSLAVYYQSIKMESPEEKTKSQDK